MAEASDTNGDEEGKPNWWLKNEHTKDKLDLPGYEPPRFSDGIYVHQIIEPLEKRYDCQITFVGVNPRYPDDWEVRIDQQLIMTIGRRRTENANTVYLMESETFSKTVLTELEE